MVRREFIRIIKYGLLGSSSFLLHGCLAYFLLFIVEVSPIIANSAAFLIAAVLYYIASRIFVFEAPDTLKTRWRYILIIIFNLFLTNTVIVGIIRWVEFTEWTAVLISILILPFSNYLLLGMWVFKDKFDVSK